MDNGLLLLINRAKLKLYGPFEGILGLGLPHSTLGHRPHGNASNNTAEFYSALTAVDESTDPAKKKDKQVIRRHGFMSEAGVKRFSMCFNDGGGGVLRVDQPPMKTMLSAIGKAHWAVEFQGISVGEASSPSLICTRDSMKKGQKTPCAAIPDSGTTLMLG